MYHPKLATIPSAILIIMGMIDCITTYIGVSYFGAAELNPFLVGIVSTNILAFLALKVTATFCIGGTYVLANKMLYKTEDKTTRTFKISNIFMKVVYAGLVMFLVAVVINNMTILLA
jgi:hypothetical protein